MGNVEKKGAISMGWFFLLIIVCIGLWVGGLYGTHYFVRKHWHSDNSITKEEAELKQNILVDSGIFGDSSGAINALFSALAFAGVIFAIILQKKELGLQREELEQTREELKGQKEEFIQQNETLRRQRFENTFFQMMSLQQEIVNGLFYSFEKDVLVQHITPGETISNETKKELRTVVGRELFLQSFENIEHKDNNRSIHYGYRGVINNLGMEKYAKFNTPSYFDHYFRHLYTIIKFIDKSPLLPDSFDERYQYVSMVRAQLSKYELIWLFYNCLSQYGDKNFKPLVEKYAILKNIREELLVNKLDKEKYSLTAFVKTTPIH